MYNNLNNNMVNNMNNNMNYNMVNNINNNMNNNLQNNFFNNAFIKKNNFTNNNLQHSANTNINNNMNNNMNFGMNNNMNNYIFNNNMNYNGINLLINKAFTTPEINNKNNLINVIFVTDKREKDLLKIPTDFTIYQMMIMYMKRKGLSESNLRNDIFFLYNTCRIDPFSNELVVKKFYSYDVFITVCQVHNLIGGFKFHI